MATPPKKKSINAHTKKKGTSKTTSLKHTSSNNTSRRKNRKAKKSSGNKQRLLIFLVFIAMIALVGVGYCLGICWGAKEKPIEKPITHHKEKEHKTVQHTSKKHTVHKVKKQKSVQKKIQAQPKTHVVKERTLPVSKLAYRGERPKLVIIIDDVHTRKQLKTIQHLPFPVTPSIFPPYTLSPHTQKLATQAVHYMIHLPMESGNAKFDRQSKTLKREFSQKQMRDRIKELRRLFPRADYINNHTGSKFTQDEKAMKMLYEVMKEEGFTFIDSRTTGHSKVGKIAHTFGDDYVARDIFLDNVKSIPAIHTQLKKAVKLAKKNGYAIAIGHPYEMTMKALQRAKPLLKEVDVVYIDEIFREK